MFEVAYSFEQTYGLPIKFYLVPDLNASLLRGVYLKFNDRVEIYLDDSLSPEWRRYIAVKEMCQLILSDPDYMTETPSFLIELMMYEEGGNPLDGEAPHDLVADMWTKFAAHELLFPRAEREQAKGSLTTGATIFSISQMYEIPEHIIEWVLRDSYSKICNDAWDEIEAVKPAF